MIIAVDFDGTIVEDKYPDIGNEKPFAIQTLKMLIEERHRLILWTVREGRELENAVEWCHQRGVDFYAVNKDFPEERMDTNAVFSRKIKADLFIDDRNVGGLPDWGAIYRMIKENCSLRDIIKDTLNLRLEHTEAPKKKYWWSRR